MFSDDLALVKELTDRFGAPTPVIEAGGLERPTIADYQLSIDAMAALRETEAGDNWKATPDHIRAAQMCRYLDKPRPLSFLGEYSIENPETGGLALEDLATKYSPARGAGIGTAILLSVLEHVNDPFEAIDRLRDAMQVGGLAIVSVPFMFPEHAQCGQDCWRFTPTGLRHLFSPPKGSELPPCWEILECDWRLRISADMGVIDMTTGKPQAIESCYLVAKAI